MINVDPKIAPPTPLQRYPVGSEQDLAQLDNYYHEKRQIILYGIRQTHEALPTKETRHDLDKH